jgi:hypothetical protein
MRSRPIGGDVKLCDRCGRRFAPRSNRQKWCNLCRPLVDVERGKDRRPVGVWFGLLPEERECATCGRVFMARQESHRFCSAWCRRRTPKPAAAQALWKLKYGRPEHKARRRSWKPVVATGTVRCARGGECVFALDGLGGFIRPWEPWDLGHVDGDPTRYSGPEHRVCNRRTAAHAAARRKGQRDE